MSVFSLVHGDSCRVVRHGNRYTTLVDHQFCYILANLTELKNKVLDAIKTFRNNYGSAVNLNQIIYFQVPEEFTETLDSSDNISIENQR